MSARRGAATKPRALQSGHVGRHTRQPLFCRPPRPPPNSATARDLLKDILRTVYLWHCDQMTSRRRLSEDISV